MSGLDLTRLMNCGTTLAAAQAAVDLGFVPVPIIQGPDRQPAVRWADPGYRPTSNELTRLFTPDRNLAVICGSRSSGLVDVDIDSDRAAPFVAELFADCPSLGRSTRPHTHVQVHCPGAQTRSYRAPKQAADGAPWNGAHGTVIVEIQADKKLATLPPSVHPCGERYTWHEGRSIAPPLSPETLNLRVASLAFMAVFSCYYPASGGRHAACLAATGVLVRAGLDGELADELVRKAARLNGDEEWSKRGGGVSAEERLARGDTVGGIKAFLAAMGLPSYWKRSLREWFFPAEPDQLVIDPTAPRDTARELIRRVFQTPEGRTLLVYQGVFHRYERGCWKALSDDEVRRIAYDFLESGVEDIGRGETIPFKPNPGRVNALLDATRSLFPPPEGVPPMWLDGRGDPPAAEVLSFTNGNLHALSQHLSPATPQFFSLTQIPRSYDPDAPEPAAFKAWVQSLWPDCPDTVSLLQEVWIGVEKGPR